MASNNVDNLQKLCTPSNVASLLQMAKYYIEPSNKDIGKAFSLLSYCLSVDNKEKIYNYKIYFKVLEEWSGKLIGNSRYEDALKLFEVAQDIYVDTPDLNYLLACALLKVDKTREAWEYALKALKVKKKDPKCRSLVSILTNLLISPWHFPMINDQLRNLAYKQAIENSIENGSLSILDIGAGTGLLSIYAQKAGATNVYACEVDEFICELAEDVFKENLGNDFETNLTLINKYSSKINIPSELPSRVDLVVTETFDAGLFGERILNTLKHAWDNLLQFSCSKVLPMKAQVFVALLECPYVSKCTKGFTNFHSSTYECQLHLHTDDPYLREKVSNLPGGYSLLTPWKNVLEVDFNSKHQIKLLLSQQLNETIEFDLLKKGRIDGLILAFKLFVDQTNCIETFPHTTSCWENAIYPLNLFNVSDKGYKISFNMTIDKTLQFTPLVPVSDSDLPVIGVHNAELLKAVNSETLKEFYRTQSVIVSGSLCSSCKIIDFCPYPEGGLYLRSLKKEECQLSISSPTVHSSLNTSNIKLVSQCSLNESADVIFFWPFTPEGTLKDNLLDEVTNLRSTFRVDCPLNLIPSYVEVHLVGIESSIISSMTRTNDEQTCGVKVSAACDLVKTLHHLDIPIEGYEYKPLTPVIKTGKLNFINCQWELEDKVDQNESMADYLVVGEETKESSKIIKMISSGRLIGFVYWFEMFGLPSIEDKGNAIHSPTCETSGSPFSIPNDDEVNFSSLSRDSPINQSILLLDDPMDVVIDQEICIQFCASGPQFLVHVS